MNKFVELPIRTLIHRNGNLEDMREDPPRVLINVDAIVYIRIYDEPFNSLHMYLSNGECLDCWIKSDGVKEFIEKIEEE